MQLSLWETSLFARKTPIQFGPTMRHLRPPSTHCYQPDPMCALRACVCVCVYLGVCIILFNFFFLTRTYNFAIIFFPYFFYNELLKVKAFSLSKTILCQIAAWEQYK